MSAPSQGQSRRHEESGKSDPIFFLSVPEGGSLQMKKYAHRAQRSLRFWRKPSFEDRNRGVSYFRFPVPQHCTLHGQSVLCPAC